MKADASYDKQTGDDLRLGRYDKIPRITAPHGAITPQQAVRDGEDDGTPL